MAAHRALPGLAALTAYPGGEVRDIVLDPDDWRVAFVADPTRVWVTADAGETWTNVTGNLVEASLRALEYGPGEVDSVFAGGLLGVYRMRLDDPGVWEQFGEGLPHAPVYDLDYDAQDDVLVAGTLGRGAWLLEQATCAGGVPAELSGLVLAHAGGIAGTTALSWTALGASVAYDTLASDDPADFSGPGASCVESNDASDTVAADSVTPPAGAVRFFVVRAVSPCGLGPVGSGSDGTPRPAMVCP